MYTKLREYDEFKLEFYKEATTRIFGREEKPLAWNREWNFSGADINGIGR